MDARLAVECPVCGALAGAGCRSPQGVAYASGYVHPVRIECPAMPGAPRCHPAICDCFLDVFPEDPLGIHPEVFRIGEP